MRRVVDEYEGRLRGEEKIVQSGRGSWHVASSPVRSPQRSDRCHRGSDQWKEGRTPLEGDGWDSASELGIAVDSLARGWATRWTRNCCVQSRLEESEHETFEVQKGRRYPTESGDGSENKVNGCVVGGAGGRL